MVGFLQFERHGRDLKVVSGSDFPGASQMRGSARAVFDSIRMGVQDGETLLLSIGSEGGSDKIRTIRGKALRRTARNQVLS